ncbi:hypothetical protein MM300_21345 [Evansella sp. LMS18]|uniref:hypothetical protein n=1 Tax=Evansella sp. LMS18 TaxID=2924033 RepID=UPI0020D05D26|nr:hypothetical protein [Evansella sp. LMS18]UTR10384.1 hypothetical protein MM300_21345 [Evansella sp. LMS18]
MDFLNRPAEEKIKVLNEDIRKNGVIYFDYPQKSLEQRRKYKTRQRGKLKLNVMNGKFLAEMHKGKLDYFPVSWFFASENELRSYMKTLGPGTAIKLYTGENVFFHEVKGAKFIYKKEPDAQVVHSVSLGAFDGLMEES